MMSKSLIVTSGSPSSFMIETRLLVRAAGYGAHVTAVDTAISANSG